MAFAFAFAFAVAVAVAVAFAVVAAFAVVVVSVFGRHSERSEESLYFPLLLFLPLRCFPTKNKCADGPGHRRVHIKPVTSYREQLPSPEPRH